MIGIWAGFSGHALYRPALRPTRARAATGRALGRRANLHDPVRTLSACADSDEYVGSV